MVYLVLGYFFFLILFGIFSYLALYHLWRFGFLGDATQTMIVSYTTVVSVIIFISFVLLIVF